MKSLSWKEFEAEYLKQTRPVVLFRFLIDPRIAYKSMNEAYKKLIDLMAKMDQDDLTKN
jgi:hypothetical protein